jgi:hypothetical protein
MTFLLEGARNLLARLRQSPSQPPGWFPIPHDHVQDAAGMPLEAEQHYFEVRINEMYLSYARQWFDAYDPMVLAVSEFTYNGQPAVVPFVVGPAMLKKLGSELPQGMIFADTCVAGPHPYREDGIAVTVVLYRVSRENYVRKLLRIIESAATALDFANALSAYMKVADVVLDGIEALTGTDGSADPIIGIHKAFDSTETGYFALIDTVQSSPEVGKLWVRDQRLVYGQSLVDAAPFREAEYVLFSVAAVARKDVSKLPFYQTWQQVVQEANKSSKQDIWESAKVNMAALLGMLDTSPDLTAPHATALGDEWIATMNRMHQRAVGLSNLGPQEEAEASDLDHIRSKALAVLNM